MAAEREQNSEAMVKTTESGSLSPPELPGKDSDIIVRIDDCIARASSREETEHWVKIREQVMEQNEAIKDNELRRRMEQGRFIRETSLTGVAFVIAICALAIDFMPRSASLLILGATLFQIAPDFVRRFIDHRKEAVETTDTSKNRSEPSLTSIGGVLIAMSYALLLVAGLELLSEDISQVLIIVVGMTGIGGLAFLKASANLYTAQSRQSGSQTKIIISHFDEKQAIANFSENEGESVAAEPWTLAPHQSVGQDDRLALARLRIEIERAIAQIAYLNGLDIKTQQRGTSYLVRELVAREILPRTWLTSIQDILKICNEAIHGVDVTDEVTESVVKAGELLLAQLRAIALHSQNNLT